MVLIIFLIQFKFFLYIDRAKHNLAKEYKQKFPESGKTVYDLLEELRVPLSQGDLINSASSESQRVSLGLQ